MVWADVSLHHKTSIVFINGNNCSSLSTRSAGYGCHSIVERPQWNAAAERWCSSLSGKGHYCISECKQRKFRRPLPQPPDLNIIENIWDELNRRVRRTGAIPTSLNQLRAKFSTSGTPPSELRSALCDINETPLSCHSEQCWGHTRY